MSFAVLRPGTRYARWYSVERSKGDRFQLYLRTRSHNEARRLFVRVWRRRIQRMGRPVPDWLKHHGRGDDSPRRWLMATAITGRRDER